MKRIITDFLSVLSAAMFYWSLVQYTDTGTIDLVELILTPEPWIYTLVVTAGIAVWRKIFSKKEVKEA